MTKQWVIHQHHHYGWTKDTEDASSLGDAVRKNVLRYHDFLTEEGDYSGKYLIQHDIGQSEYPRYQVIWNDDEPRNIFGGQINKGDIWFSGRILSGNEDDCDKCGGTGVNFYNPFRQCWVCGNPELIGITLCK